MNSKLNIPVSGYNNLANIPKKRWWPAHWLVPLVSLPVVLSLAAVVWLSYRETQAIRRFELLKTSFRMGSEPAAVAGWQEAFRESTTTQASAQWSRIYFLLSSQKINPTEQLPIVGNATLPFLVDPAQPWEAEQRVDDYLTQMQVVLELIHQAATGLEPVWQPIGFNGYATLLPHLQATRDPARLLQLEAELAIYRGEPQTAMAAIAALQGTARSIDWDIFMVAQVIQSSIQDMHLRTIQRSLHIDLWNVEQLEQLISQIDQPIAIEETFQKIVRSEAVVVNSILESKGELFPGMRAFEFPSAKLELLQNYHELEKIASQGAGRLSKRVGKQEEQWLSSLGSSNLLAGQFMPSFTAYALSIELTEQLRQLTLVGLGLKRFQLEYQRWPRELAELSKVGLTRQDWTIVGLGAMGYSDEGQRAYVWGVQRGETSIAPRRPAWEEGKFDEAYHLVVVSK